ncbi:MAG: lysylphosphatidylglycerol synthase transmembrane domain-containing protein [Acidimicrobiales bacterium]
MLVTSLVVAAVAAWAHAGPTGLDIRAAELVEPGIPGWLDAVFATIFAVGALYPIGLFVAVLVFGQGRRAIARDMFLAAALAIGASTVASLLAGPEWPDVLPEFFDIDGTPSYPVVRLSMAMAIVGVASPYLSVPMRKVGNRMIIPMAVSAVALTYGSVSAVIGSLAVGLGSAATIHLILGSGVGIPSKARVIDALRNTGVEATGVEYLDDQPIGVSMLAAARADGSELTVKVYGRDATDAALVSRLWRKVWYRDDGRALSATGLQMVEHEGLMLLEGDRAGLRVPTLVSWGRSQNGDALLATERSGARELRTFTGSEITDDDLSACWHALAQLHETGMAHRGIDRKSVTLLGGVAGFAEMSHAVMSPDGLTRSADIAQMLVSTALAVGQDRAIERGRVELSDDEILEALPLLQASALSSDLRDDAKASDLDLEDLRSAVADTLDTEVPELAQLARVSWGNVAMAVLTVFAAYSLISSLADIGFDTIVEELSNAEWSWVLIAFVLAQLTNVGEWFSLTGMVTNPVPFGPTIQFRYALSFISLAVPSEAGAIAMNIRYMQKLGVTAAAAVAQGPLLTVFSKGFDIILLLITMRTIDESIDLDEVDSGPIFKIIILAVVLVVVGLAVSFLVPSLREKVVPPIKEAFSAVRDPLTDPQRLMRIAGGTLLSRFLFALTLAASTAAYGADLSFSEAIFVNSIVSLFIGFMPVPGGIGVGEAALTAGLTAVGVPAGPALAAAITHRMVTSYLPPVYGWFTTRWLTANDYL